MLASELIEELKKLIEEHGDLPCFTWEDFQSFNNGYTEVSEPILVENKGGMFENEEAEKFFNI